jgi:hypothetical protein
MPQGTAAGGRMVGQLLAFEGLLAAHELLAAHRKPVKLAGADH